MTKSWTELLGQPQPHDQLYKNEIIRPTDYFTLSDFGHRQIIWKTLWKFDCDSRAKEVFDIWIKEKNNE
jgi:hypothetical protein